MQISPFLKFFISFVIAGTILGGVVGYYINTRLSEIDKSNVKYCYFYNNNKGYPVEMTEDMNQAYRILYSYLCKLHQKSTQLNVYEGTRLLEPNTQCYITEYSKDSLLVEITIEVHSQLRGGMDFEAKGYVPFFTIHDSVTYIPSLKSSNE